MEVLQGDNQTDTVGHPLKDMIELRVYKDGKLFVNSTVLFKGSGCIANDSVNMITATQGNNDYQWYLSADVGIQTLKIVLCDSAKNHLDSLTLHATALKASGVGILACACAFGGASSPNFAPFYKLHSGRIIASTGTTPKYSDDNGLSWYPINALTNFFLKKIVVTPTDKLYALTSAGVIYSTDQGITWYLLVRDDPNNLKIFDIDYTQGGKLSYSTSYLIYISSDEGKTWKKAQPPVTGSSVGFFGLREQLNGDLFLVSAEGGIYRSTDGGTTWASPNNTPADLNRFYTSIFIDDNGYIYLSGSDASGGGIYLSKDNAQTFNKIAFTPFGYDQYYMPDKISKQHDGYYYIRTTLNGYYRTRDFVNLENVNSRFNIPAADMIVADNNNLVLSTGKFSEFSYIPNQ